MDEYPVLVEGDWEPEQAKSVNNKLQIYFQSKKKSQGGDCVVYNFSGNICFRLTIRIRRFYTLVNQILFPTDFRNKLWVGLGLGVGIGLNLYF
uniref:PAR14-like first RRM domain-containing protein n=1 Tax=Cyprinus carpio TaxID=7962 RepID=A0A8C1GQ99_CYPCA